MPPVKAARNINIVPDAATGQLGGFPGRTSIDIRHGQHLLDNTLP